MKRYIVISGILLLAAAIAYPVFAHGPRWGRGHHMMGDWGSGPDYGLQDWRGYGALSDEQQARLDQLEQEFYKDTSNLRNEIRVKSTELDTLLNSPDPDIEKVKALNNEISDLRAKMAEKRINYELEARKVDPDARSSGREYGRGYGMGYGRHMRGYGPGGCWD